MFFKYIYYLFLASSPAALLPPALHLNNGVMDMQMTIVQLLRRAEGECVILISNGPFYSVMKMQIAPSCWAEMEPGDGVAPAAARSKILKSAGEEGPPPPHCQQMSLKKKI